LLLISIGVGTDWRIEEEPTPWTKLNPVVDGRLEDQLAVSYLILLIGWHERHSVRKIPYHLLPSRSPQVLFLSNLRKKGRGNGKRIAIPDRRP